MRSFNDRKDNAMNESKASKLTKGVLAAGFVIGGVISLAQLMLLRQKEKRSRRMRQREVLL